VRIAVVTESYLPQVNGVTNSVVRATAELRKRGHEVVIVAPGQKVAATTEANVVRTGSFGLPGYREVKVGLASRIVDETLRAFRPDVIHLASPVALGAAALRTAREVNIPAVAVYQTDLARYAAAYHLPFGRASAWRWLRRIHNRADLTLAPSTPVAAELVRRGFRRVRIWRRGVDTELFDPSRASSRLRATLADDSQLLVGYVGRIAADKEVRHLTHLAGLKGVRLVVVGDGPARSWLEKRLPDAHFTGFAEGVALASLFATFDLVVHSSRLDTFGQVIQESLASGTPVLAPNSGGPLDLVASGHNGVLWDAGRPDMIADVVAWLDEDRHSLSRLAANARASVAHRTWPRIVDDLEEHYWMVAHRVKAEAA
jgi:phosphatidylinositol alpha 1,6-mannosyltransferase